MTKFIKLTIYGSDIPVYIKKNTIATITEEKTGSSIEHTNGISNTIVKESPEEVIKLINESENK